MAANQIEKLVNLYKTVSGNPSLTGARILQTSNSGITVQSKWSQRNLERKTNQKFVQTHILNNELVPTYESFPTDITTELLSAFTEDQQRKAILRQATVENSTKQFLEIWDKQHLAKNYDLAALDKHGDVYTDSEFQSFEWSPDKTKVLYIAEKKLPKSGPFYKQKSEKNDDEISVGNEYIYKPHWGEQLVGKHHPVVAVLDTTTDTISVIPNIPDEVSPAQVLWTKDGQGIIGVAWKHEPYHLGLIACTNRLSWIFLYKDQEYKKLSGEGHAVRCPRLSPDKKSLIWLEREAGGAHHNAHRLMYLNLESDEHKIETLVDIVSTNIPIKNSDKFFGLYGLLPHQCWSSDSQFVFLSTRQQNSVHSYIIDTKTKSITEIQDNKHSLNILDVTDNVIAFSETSFLEPSFLSIGRFVPDVINTGSISRTQITYPPAIPGFEELMYDTVEYDYNNDNEVQHFNFIYFGPKTGKDKSVPLLITPHGGPHSNYVNMFTLDHSMFVLAGFAVVQVNYRGSTGMGSKNVEYLQGKVGDVDVKDCVTATHEALKRYPWLDPSRIACCGGSHGGFLVTHLSGQYPDLYKAIVARNPVIDIAAMFTISDIPDWCAAEINYLFDEKTITESNLVEVCVKMFSCSPIMYAHKVKAPTLLCIGTNDLRVPPSQGKLWYNRLKGRDVKTKMLVYDDNHPLNSGTAEIDNIINACLWLLEHTSLEASEDIAKEP